MSQKSDEIKFIDLFAGTGAFSLALESHPSKKFKCVFSNDLLKSSKTIYDQNHSNVKLTLGNINNIDIKTIPKHDLLCGGFPCQSFSIAGKREGFKDKRANVFFQIIKILKKHKPQFIILENVKNLKSHDSGKTYETIEKSLNECGYKIKSEILDTSKVTDIPQHRERIYIVGFRSKKLYDKFDFNFPVVQNKKISDILEKTVDKKYYYTDKLKVYKTVKEKVTKNVEKDNVLYQYRRHYVRENKSNCCPTLTANMGSGGHNVPLLKDKKGIRKLTPRECFNFQGFPSTYKLDNLSNNLLYSLAGNAVSVPVVKLIVDKLEKIL